MTRGIALQIPSDHPALAGHFPGMPVVPGVVLLDELLHAIGREEGYDLSACRLATVKFLSPLLPGEPLSLEYEMADAGALKFDLFSGERRIAAGSLRLLQER